MDFNAGIMNQEQNQQEPQEYPQNQAQQNEYDEFGDIDDWDHDEGVKAQVPPVVD